MKAYRKHLIAETAVLSAASTALIIVQALAWLRVITPEAAAEGVHWGDFWNGMIAGASCGLAVLFIIGIVINIRALRNEERLKKLYAKENDERTVEIVRRAQSFGMRVSTCLMLAGGLVLGYFDAGLSVVCLGCALLQSVITVLAKLYWHRQL